MVDHSTLIVEYRKNNFFLSYCTLCMRGHVHCLPRQKDPFILEGKRFKKCFSYSMSRYNATDMNLYKSALSACVVRDLPDVRDYVYKKADCEDRDQPLLAEGDPVPATSSGAVGQDNQLVMYSSEVERAMSYLTPSSLPSISPSSPMLTSSSSSTSST